MQLQLVRPTSKLKISYLQALRDFEAEGWFSKSNIDQIEFQFESYVQQLLLKEKAQTLNAETELWGIFKACFVGRIYIRHHLTDALREVGGHIGYETAPAFRRMGVGSAMLSQALPIAKSLGLSEVLMTCDDNNLASIKIIEKNGGILREKKQIAQGKPIKRYYWIVL